MMFAGISGDLMRSVIPWACDLVSRSFLSAALLRNSIAAALDPTLDVAEGTVPVASAIDVWAWDPPAVSSYQRVVHDWICDRAPALELLSVQFLFRPVFLRLFGSTKWC